MQKQRAAKEAAAATNSIELVCGLSATIIAGDYKLLASNMGEPQRVDLFFFDPPFGKGYAEWDGEAFTADEISLGRFLVIVLCLLWSLGQQTVK